MDVSIAPYKAFLISNNFVFYCKSFQIAVSMGDKDELIRDKVSYGKLGRMPL